jgi:DNA-binding protein H-NS
MEMNVEQIESVEDLDALIEAAKNQKVVAKERAIERIQKAANDFKAMCADAGVSPTRFLKEDSIPKFANPANPEETYTGFGPRPPWLKALLEGVPKGKQKDVMEGYRIAA